MKNKICPKCNSIKIKNIKKFKTDFISMKVPVKDSLLDLVQAVYYICLDCGYLEMYIEDKKALSKIAKEWND